MTAASEHLLNEAPLLIKTILDKFPPEQLLADLRLVNLRASALIQLGDMAGAYRSYREVLTQKTSGALAVDGIAGYRRMAETLAQRNDYGQAINQLRSALNVISQESAAWLSRARSGNQLAWVSAGFLCCGSKTTVP